MTEIDIIQIETFIHSITEKLVENRIQDDDVKNMLNTIASLAAEVRDLRIGSTAKVKLIRNFMEAR